MGISGARSGAQLDHMSSSCQFPAELTHAYERLGARSIGPNTEGLIIAVIASRRHPKQPFRPNAVRDERFVRTTRRYTNFARTRWALGRG